MSIPTREERATVEYCGVRLLGIHQIDAQSVVYRAAIPTDLKSTRQRLAGGLKGFYNIVFETPEDKVTPAVFLSRGFAKETFDEKTGHVFASIVFHRGVPADRQLDALNGVVDSILFAENNVYTVLCSPGQLVQLSRTRQVANVSEVNPRPVVATSLQRQSTKVDSIQLFNIAALPFPPIDTMHWSLGNRLTGDSIWVGIYDEGIDSTIVDFKDSLSVGGYRVRRCRDSLPWETPSSPHGTHVGGIAAGSGWRSDLSGGQAKYRWRGAAPKALLLSQYMSTTGDAADVNNHSHSADNSWYDQTSMLIDNELRAHGRLPDPANIMVYAAHNYGQGGGGQIAYYSLRCCSKNPIVVANVEQQTGIRYYESSMGPTRDGRIGVTIAAPAAAAPVTDRWQIEVDYIRLLDSTGAVKQAWEFSNSLDSMHVTAMSAPVVRDSTAVFDMMHGNSLVTDREREEQMRKQWGPVLVLCGTCLAAEVNNQPLAAAGGGEMIVCTQRGFVAYGKPALPEPTVRRGPSESGRVRRNT